MLHRLLKLKQVLCLLALLLSGHVILAIPPEQLEFFETKIRPVLAENCYECHNSVNKKKAKLALDYKDALLAGSENGDVIVPGKPEERVLIWAIRHEDEDLEMPPKADKLSDAVITALD